MGDNQSPPIRRAHEVATSVNIAYLLVAFGLSATHFEQICEAFALPTCDQFSSDFSNL
jgi:hypothetical protein